MKNVPKLYDLPVDKIDESIIIEIINLVSKKRDFVITPLSILNISGFPTTDQIQVLNNRHKIRKIKTILIDLKTKGILEQRISKQDFLGIKEIGYNLVQSNL